MLVLKLLLGYSIKTVCWMISNEREHFSGPFQKTIAHSTFFCLCVGVFTNWRASEMRTSAELINNNLDKLSLPDRSARPHNHTTEDWTITGWARDMTGSSPDQWKALLDRRPAAWGEDTMIHGQRATWKEWFSKLSTPPTNTSMPFTGENTSWVNAEMAFCQKLKQRHYSSQRSGSQWWWFTAGSLRYCNLSWP